MNMTVTFKTKVVEGFNTFYKNWDFDDFWRRANTLDACTHLMMAAKKHWPNDPAIQEMENDFSTILSDNISYFDDKKSGGNWADDYGWWGFAAIRAYHYCTGAKKTDLASCYLAIAKESWSIMLEKGYDKAAKDGCRNSASPKDTTAAKNTVTNANLLLVSTWLYDATEDTRYLQMAYAQYQWFNKYIVVTSNAPNPTAHAPYMYLQKQLGNVKAGLITERPWPTSNYNSPDHPGWEAGWAWTGDQGLFLACMTGLLDIADDIKERVDNALSLNDFKTIINSYIDTVANGTKDLLFDTDKVLHEPPFSSSFGSSFGIDYVSGKGVFLRFLADSKHGSVDFTDCIKKTADAVWASREAASNQFSSIWNSSLQSAYNQNFIKKWGYGDSVSTWGLVGSNNMVNAVLQAAGLDALAAAIPLSG